ncbi:hypothetical protein BLA6863_04052 [Burkholderia lata]|uniref:Uncharacterized protein n=1 Tax=Burkholderia lata (strain ATCC 17760 / DSM 23089 / LMG 22485 / NCIMB 9086 / R18194 / 383) TaxID=482957 RepID=A0A6P2MRX0_BURL3|nr:hypothetical protein BLA6863_04052 [Burkholderia lata]
MIGRLGGGGAIGATTIGLNTASGLLRIVAALRSFQRTALVSVVELIGILIWMTDYVAQGVRRRLV